ncbi:MAG: 50S ribosomal protein L22 [Chthonomonadaceae bacterium]|nr:50S ribosomal protein L22 [Chthonomonadaceae bacterium]
MEVRAVAKYIRVQPRKVRIVADEVRGVPAQRAADVLRFHPSKGAFHLRKVVISAMANAQENLNLSPENLRIATIMVDEGPKMKRITARSMGRANRILKKTSHITVVVEEFQPEATVKPHGTKAKARPKFETPKTKKAKSDKKEKVEETVAAETVDTVAEEPVTSPEPIVEDTPTEVAETTETEEKA